MSNAQPGIYSTVPGTILPEVGPGTVTVDATLTGTGAAASPISVVQSYRLALGSFLSAALPSPAAHLGATAIVTDSSVILWGTTVAGGGTSVVLVWSNGTNWTVVGI